MAVETNYNLRELLACNGAKVLEDKKSVFVGTGLPMIASMLAQKTHAPNLLIVFEAGSMGPMMKELPISVGDSRTFYKAVSASSMHDSMSLSQAGYIDYGFLGAAQMDMHGNINTTMIGDDWYKPKVRLPGSGGANDVGSLCGRTIILMRHDKIRFVNKLDFLTTPGYLTGPGAREKAGLPRGTGPYRVITQLGVLGFDEETKAMKLLSVHPGVSVEDVVNNTSFQLVMPRDVGVTQAPSAEELRLLREEIDPAGIVIGG